MLRIYIVSLALLFSFRAYGWYVEDPSRNYCNDYHEDVLPMAQVRDLCNFNCKAYLQSGTIPIKSKYTSDSTCRFMKAEYSQSTSYLVGCAAGAWSALAENFQSLAEVLAPSEYQAFVKECSQNAGCKRNLARSIDRYRERGEDGSYKMSDSQVDAEIKSLDFPSLIRTSKHYDGLTYDSCQRSLATINQKLQNDPQIVNSTKPMELAQKRFQLLNQADPDCANLLHLSSPTAENTKVDLAKAGAHLRDAVKAPVANVSAKIDAWFAEMKIAPSCYDQQAQAELLCDGLGQVLFNAEVAGAGGMFAARAVRAARLANEESRLAAAARATEESMDQNLHRLQRTDYLGKTNEARAANDAVLQKLDQTPHFQRNPDRSAGLTKDQLNDLWKKVKTNPINSSCLRTYDPTGNIGFCFGKAFNTHVEALKMGVQKEDIKKIWVVGKLGHWGHHVATLVRGTDKVWYAIDPLLQGPVPAEQWYKRFSQMSDSSKRIFITDARRFSPTSSSKYAPYELLPKGNSDVYNGYFRDMIGTFQNDSKLLIEQQKAERAAAAAAGENPVPAVVEGAPAAESP